MPENYLTEQQVAARFSVGIRTVQRWRACGLGPAFLRLGPRRIVYREADVDRWATSRTFANGEAERQALAELGGGAA